MEKITVSSQFYIKALIFLGALVWGFFFIFKIQDPVNSFLHLPNLAFHEAGHIIFIPLGDFMTVLGGSLFQILMPVAVLVHFFQRKDFFGAAMSLWWVGQNFIDVALYIGDAKDQNLILIGGVTGRERPGFHDWNNLLSRFDALDSARFLENLAHISGSLIIIYSLYWGFKLLYQDRTGREFQTFQKKIITGVRNLKNQIIVIFKK